MVMRMDTSYQTSGAVTLLNSNQKSTNNPYLAFDQSLQTTAQVLGTTFSTDDVHASYAKKGLSPNFTVEVPYDPTRTVLLPMVQVSVTADSPKVAGETRDALMNDLQDELSRVQTQAGAPRESWIQAFPKPNEKILPVAGSKARTFVIVFGIGAALALMVAFVVDGFQKGVRRTRRGATIVLDTTTPEQMRSRTDKPVPKRARTTRKKPQSNPKATAAKSGSTTPSKAPSQSPESTLTG